MPPTRLGDCARFIRIISVLDACGANSEQLKEDDIALVAALLCCRSDCGYGSQFVPEIVAQNLLPGLGGNHTIMYNGRPRAGLWRLASDG